MKRHLLLSLGVLVLVLVGCGGEAETPPSATLPPTPITENRPPRPPDLPTAQVVEVIDAVTLKLDNGEQVRLIGLLPPQLDPLAADAATFTRELLVGKRVGLETGFTITDEADHHLYYVWVENLLANYEILRLGYSSYLVGGVTELYDSFLAQAQEKALKERLGLWQGLSAVLVVQSATTDPTGEDELNLNGEVIEFFNNSDEIIILTGYTVRDKQGNSYVFGEEAQILPRRTMTLSTGCGFENVLEYFWCSSVPIWDNTGDTVFLYDVAGTIATYADINP